MNSTIIKPCMMEILGFFSIDVAREKNKTFKYFVDKYIG